MFGFKNKSEVIERQGALIREMEFEASEKNELFRALYEFLATGLPLGRDSKMKEYVKEGYEGNPDIFSIVMKLGGMFARVLENARLIETKSGKEKEVENEEIDRLFEKTNYYQNFYEFCRDWEIFFLLTGNAITYAPKLTAGLNKGKIDKDGLLLMPTQNVIIEAGGWRQPIKNYVLDINQTYKIDTYNIWHERFAPTLQFEGGKNFMGMSPIKVAMNIINSQNAGYEVTAKLYRSGHPPGILSKEVENKTETLADQEARFREKWKTKYTGIENTGVPLFTLGKLGYTKIGFENLQELEIINMSEHGRRIFCNLLGTPSQLFNDSSSSIYKNLNEARKTIYENRIIPDVSQFCAGFNLLLRPYGDFELKPDYSTIDALQEEKEQKVKWISQLYADGIITGDKYLEMIGEEPTGLPEMQIRYMDANRMPVNMLEEGDISQGDKFYRVNQVPNGM